MTRGTYTWSSLSYDGSRCQESINKDTKSAVVLGEQPTLKARSTQRYKNSTRWRSTLYLLLRESTKGRNHRYRQGWSWRYHKENEDDSDTHPRVVLWSHPLSPALRVSTVYVLFVEKRLTGREILIRYEIISWFKTLGWRFNTVSRMNHILGPYYRILSLLFWTKGH